MTGSVQYRRYLTAREHGHGRVDAAEFAGIGLSEAALIDQDKGWAPKPARRSPTSEIHHG